MTLRTCDTCMYFHLENDEAPCCYCSHNKDHPQYEPVDGKEEKKDG